MLGMHSAIRIAWKAWPALHRYLAERWRPLKGLQAGCLTLAATAAAASEAPVALLIALPCFILGWRKASLRSNLLKVAILLFLGALLHLSASYRLAGPLAAPSIAPNETPLVAQAQVVSIPTGTDRTSCILLVEGRRYLAFFPDRERPVPGQRLLIRGSLRPGMPATNFGQPDPEVLLRSRNLVGYLNIDEILEAHPAPRWQRMLQAGRDGFQNAIHEHMGPSSEILAEAAFLGIRDNLSEGLVEGFRSTGLMHLLAISGLHVGIIAGCLLAMGSLLRLPQPFLLPIIALVLTGYALMVGGIVSVARSVLMICCLFPALLGGKPTRGLNALGLACACILLWAPYQVLSVGFQLSFAATFFLIWCSPFFSRASRVKFLCRKPMSLIRASLLVSFVALMATVPLMSAIFHAMAPAGLLGNVVAIPLAAALVANTFLCLLSHWLFPWAASCFGASADLFGSLLETTVMVTDWLPGTPWHTAWPSPIVFAFCWTFLFLLKPAVLWGKVKPLGYVAALGLALIFLIDSMALGRNDAEIVFLDVGQGDAAMIHLPGADILIDAGAGPPYAFSGKRKIHPYLAYRGINRLHMVVLTHPDYDHYGGLTHLIGRVRIDRIVFGGDSSNSQAWLELRRSAEEHRIPMQIAGCGDLLYKAGETRLTVLAPCGGDAFGDRNNRSLVSLFRHDQHGVLFTGDIEESAEERVAARLGHFPAPNVLKVPHHGAATGTGLALLERVPHGVAIISAGRSNRYGHPHEAVMDRLRGRGYTIYGTPWNGAVSMVLKEQDATWKTRIPTKPASAVMGEAPLPILPIVSLGKSGQDW